MSRIDELALLYRNHISAPWQRNLAGAQKAIFVVYPKEEERRLRVRFDLFETNTIAAGHKWRLVDLTSAFAKWMASMEYRDAYFEEPDDLALKLKTDFIRFLADELRQHFSNSDVDDNTVVAVHCIASLFGLAHLSLVQKEIERDIQGRLVVFYPGHYENGNYRLLDARDGWNYHAVPITLNDGGEQ